MENELQHIASRMESEGQKTIAFFSALPREAWNQQVYTTGTRWNVHLVLAHFVSAELGFAALVRDVVADGGGAPQDFDIDEFNERQVAELKMLDPDALLERFEAARSDLSALVQDLSSDDLDRLGHHPWFGKTEMRKALKLVYRHNMIHLRDVRKALDSGNPVPHLDVQPPADE